MIGVYDYTVILTYISLVSSVYGMTCAVAGKFRTAIVCLAISGLCDMFDGRIARTKKNRTDEEKSFGIQIDSLCDIVCFGVFPSMICYLLGVDGVFGIIVIVYYCLCSLIRLAWYNVQESAGKQVDESGQKFYHGLPITTMAILLPLVFLLNFLIPKEVFIWILHGVLIVVGTMFVTDFRLKKPSNIGALAIAAIVGVAVLVIVLFSQYRISRMREMEGPALVDMDEEYETGEAGDGGKE